MKTEIKLDDFNFEIRIVDIDQIKENPNNPRLIRKHEYKKLLKSLKDLPEGLNINPIKVDQDMIVIGGNMRLKACKELGFKEIPIMDISSLSKEKQMEFLIKDNISFGEWDYDMLANEWNHQDLYDWGLNIPAEIDLDEIKETGDIPDQGEMSFSEELLLEHNYIVLYFDNELDWEVAKEKYGLKDVISRTSAEGTRKIGIGRVLNGKDYL